MTVPSSSAKQHRFMEAIAHSPSFAKKVGVPQSVGKDYAAADKGKTFSKGGEMKESKAMVGKEVAFMKKKGAPKSMIKHEEAEMKRGGNTSRMNRLEELGRVNAEKASTPKGKRNLAEEKTRIVGELNKYAKGGRVRRMAEGGETDMSMGYGDPFAKPRNYESEKERGAKTMKGIKDFFGFGEKESAPIERRTISEKPAETMKPRWSGMGDSDASKSAIPERVVTPNVTQQMAAREKAGESGSANVGPDYGMDSGSSSQTFKPRRRPVTISETKETKSITATPKSGTALKEAQEQAQRAKDAFKPAKEKGYGALGLTDEDRAANREAVSGFFGKLGKTFKDLYNVETPAERRLRERKAKERESIYTGTTPGAKKGGSVKKMASGGTADGIAQKGKTQGKVVKMASGGFVKNADGCAQRGKTKAFQVKMSRGGKC